MCIIVTISHRWIKGGRLNNVWCVWLFQERDTFSQVVSKHQKEIQDLQVLVHEESQTRVRLQMEMDAKDSEIEALHRTIANFNSETASLSSGADNDIDELG